jgi:hypothetical protein
VILFSGCNEQVSGNLFSFLFKIILAKDSD